MRSFGICILAGALLLAAAGIGPAGATERCSSVSQPVHSYGQGAGAGANSQTMNGQTGGSPFGSVGSVQDPVVVAGTERGGVGSITVSDTNTADCNGDGVPGDFDGDYDVGVGGGFFGSTNAWDVEDNCGYGLNVHATSGTATDVTGLPVNGTYGVDDVAGPTVVTDPTTGATLDCMTDGSITPATDANDCLADWVGSWSASNAGEGVSCATAGGDDGYWLFLNTWVQEECGNVTGGTATAGTLAASF